MVLPSIAGRDFYELTETCAGLGALGRGAQAVGWRTAVANDKQETMCDLLRSLADHPVICGDIAYPSTSPCSNHVVEHQRGLLVSTVRVLAKQAIAEEVMMNVPCHYHLVSMPHL